MIIRIIYCIVILMLFSCVASPRYSSSTPTSKNKITKKYNSRSLSKGNPKAEDVKVGDIISGISSWYGPNFHGKLTANGEVFDQYGVTAAHKTLPLGTVARITNIDNGKSLILRINDRGPYVGDRILDCSYGAATKLGFKDLGTANVEIKIIEIGDGVYMHHINK
tara:strand:+ start:3437 stop:3931 length:495 start_codon:yes stop_codon:yes gene_type:complete